MKKGQLINIDWTIALSLFLVSSLSAVLFLGNINTGPNQINSLQSKALEIQSNLEEETSINAVKLPLISQGPTKSFNIPIDRQYNFPSDAHHNSGSGEIPAELDIEENNVIAVTDSGNTSKSLVFFKEEVDEQNYNNNIQTNGNWINNSKISLRLGGSGINSLKVNNKEVLNTDADLGSGSNTINESDIYAETLSGNLKLFDNSSEIIIDNRSQNLTFNLQNFDTAYWNENDSEIELTGTGVKAEGNTKGFSIASSYGLTFLGNMETKISKPSESTVKAEIDAEKIRIRLHDSGIETGKDRIEFFDKGYIVLGAGQKFSAPYSSKIKQLNSETDRYFESALDTEEFGYNIGLGFWINGIIEDLSDWNKGDYNGTSASRKDNSGDLGIGYRNGNSEDSLVGYWRLERENLMENPGFENDEVGKPSPSSWKYPNASGWNVTDSFTAPESSGEKSFGSPWQDGPSVWPDAYIYNDFQVEGGKDYIAEASVRLQSYSDGNWNGAKSDRQYIYEDDARLHLYFYDNSGNLLKEEKTRWIGDAYNRGLNYIEKNGNWFKFRKIYSAPQYAEKVRFQIDGGDNNNDYGDPETSHGGNAGIWIDDNSLTGKKALDYSGEGNDGIPQNGVDTTSKGIFATKAFSFDGSDDKVKVKMSDSLRIDSTITLSAWIKTTSRTKTEGIIDTQEGSSRGYRITVENDALEFGIYSGENGGGYTELNGETNISDNRWHHVVGTWDGENMTIYVDGVEDGAATQSELAEPDQDLYIGVRDVDNGYLNGKIDSPRVYNKALSAEKVKQLYLYGGDGKFNGNYNFENHTGSFQNWEDIQVEAEIPEETSAEILFESLDSDENVIDGQIIDLKSGSNTYNINSDSSSGYRITFRGNSTDPEKTWEVKEYDLTYGPELNRGSIIPLDTSAVVSNRPSALINRNGSFSEIQNRVVLWP